MKYALALWVLLSGLQLSGQSTRPDTLSFEDVASWIGRWMSDSAELVRPHLPSIISRLEEHGTPRQRISVYHAIAAFYYVNRWYGHDSIGYYQAQTVRAARETGDSALVADRLRNLAIFLKDSAQPTEGRERIMEALRIYQALGDERGVIAVRRVLCDFYREAGLYSQAVENIVAVVKYYEARGDTVSADDARLCHLAALHNAERNLEALAIADTLLRYPEGHPLSNPNRRFILWTRWWAEQDIPDTAAAIITGRELVRLERVQSQRSNNAGMFLSATLELKLLERDMEGVLAPALDLVNFDRTGTNLKDQIYSRKILVNALRSTGRFQQALYHQDTLLNLTDKYHQLQIETVKGELLLKYDNEQRDQKIAAQQEQLDTQRTNQLRTLAFSLLLLLALAAMVWLLWSNARRRRQLAARNAEIELLLREIHHRVKNNLEVVSSLLELQSEGLAAGVARAAMQTGQDRVRSIGLLHQRLYQNEYLASVELGKYFEDLADSLLESYDLDGQLRIDVEVPECYTSVDSAVPLGLIANELLTNSIKYAYPDGRGGRIRVAMREEPTGEWRFSVRDWGVGKGAATAVMGTGFGSKLIAMLARQLNAQVQEFDNHGLITVLLVKLSPPGN